MNKTARNERLKLSATYVNGIAIALIAVGAFGPVIALAQSGNLSAIGIFVVMVCVVVSFALHFVGRWLLRGMDE